MTMMLVRDGTREAHLALERDGRLYTYDHHTRAFHLNRGLTLDYFTEAAMTYEVLDDASADAVIHRGVGKLDRRTMGWLVDQHQQDPDAIALVDVLASPEPANPRQQTQARARAVVRALLDSPTGRWIDWRTYDADRRQTAHVAASDLRHHKNKILAEVGPLEACVVGERGKYVVKVRRPDDSTPTSATKD